MSDAKPVERPRGGMRGTYLTPNREKLLHGVADLEISMEEDGSYRWLGGLRVNAGLEALEAEGWITFGHDTGVPHITGLGRIALRDAKAAGK